LQLQIIEQNYKEKRFC